MYARGVTVPLIGITFHAVPDSRYDTVVVYGQWDGWAAPPDRPWNALAVVNAVMGALYTVNGSNDHSRAATRSQADAVLVSDITNSLGGRVTTYMIPEANLPITRPLRQLGVPGPIVDRLNELLLPWIRAGYSSMTPGLGLRFDNGRLHWGPPPAPPTPTPAPPAPSAMTAAVGNDTRADRVSPLRDSLDIAPQELPNELPAEEAELTEDPSPAEPLSRREFVKLIDAEDVVDVDADMPSGPDTDESTPPGLRANDNDPEADPGTEQDSPESGDTQAAAPADAAA
jgi:hypothetical protein